MILDKILDYERVEVEQARAEMPLAEVKAQALDRADSLDFGAALVQQSGFPAVIAEVKKASPSKGLIRPDFDPEAIARAYEAGGASAISVLTDKEFFQGSPEYLKLVKKTVSLPVLRKDFIIDEYQVYEAAAMGADAILLIVAALDLGQIVEYRDLALSLGMASLVEVHSEDELATAIKANADIIGINNRNLQTFEVSLDTTKRLLPEAKKSGAKVVSESGIFTKEDMLSLAHIGADAALIGEALMREDDIEVRLRGLIS